MQLVHVELLVAPTVDEYVPALQFVHVELEEAPIAEE